jgi:hypothetical protein
VTFKSLLKSGGLAALAIALATPALSASASAQERPQRGTWSGGNGAAEAQQQRAARQEQRAARQEVREERQEVRQQNRQVRQAAPPQQRAAPPSPPQQARGENRGDDRSQRWQGQNRSDTARRSEGIYNPQLDRNRDRSGERVVARDRQQAQQQPQARVNRGNWNGGRDSNTWQGSRDGRDTNRGDRDGSWQDNRDGRDYRDGDRNTSYRDSDRNRSYRDNDRRDHRQWDRRWRDSNRYNWSSYRYSNRHIYTPGRYYAPYRNYSYRRLSIGFSLDRLFFGNRYWINDPWQYRLPEVYGDYRWIRYYDDVLLVDMYTGEVVDVIYDFFW